MNLRLTIRDAALLQRLSKLDEVLEMAKALATEFEPLRLELPRGDELHVSMRLGENSEHIRLLGGDVNKLMRAVVILGSILRERETREVWDAWFYFRDGKAVAEIFGEGRELIPEGPRSAVFAAFAKKFAGRFNLA